MRRLVIVSRYRIERRSAWICGPSYYREKYVKCIPMIFLLYPWGSLFGVPSSSQFPSGPAVCMLPAPAEARRPAAEGDVCPTCSRNEPPRVFPRALVRASVRLWWEIFYESLFGTYMSWACQLASLLKIWAPKGSKMRLNKSEHHRRTWFISKWRLLYKLWLWWMSRSCTLRVQVPT